MPLIDIESYIIDFVFLEGNSRKTIDILDKSNYLDDPEKPLIAVTLPGFTGHVEVPYITGGIISLNSDNLGITSSCEYADYADLPDGVYQVTMKVCPYDELFNKKCYLRSTQLELMYQELLLNVGSCDCIDEKKTTNELIEIDILIQSAKAETSICNVQAATTKYQIAMNKVMNLTKKLNCK